MSPGLVTETLHQMDELHGRRDPGYDYLCHLPLGSVAAFKGVLLCVSVWFKHASCSDTVSKLLF